MYTTIISGMFYMNLSPDLRNQVKVRGYMPPESFTTNDSQVKDLRVLRDLALKAELEVATIVGISRKANGMAVNTVRFQDQETRTPDCYDWNPSAAPVMNISPSMARAFPPPPCFSPPPLYHDHPVFSVKTFKDGKFAELYETYARCNRSVAENSLFKAHNPEAGVFDVEKCWGCAKLYPNDCFHQLWVCPHREDPRVCARALPFLKELSK